MTDNMTTIDLSNYKDKVGNRVAPGRYRVLVEDAEQDKSAAGNEMINLWFRVLDGDFEGATIVDRLVLTEKSLFRVVGFMQAIGLQTPKKRLSVNIRQWVGKVLEIDVEDGDPYNGRVKSEVRGYNRSVGAKAGKAAADLDDVEPGSDEEATEKEGLDEFAADTTSNPVDAAVDLNTLDLG